MEIESEFDIEQILPKIDEITKKQGQNVEFLQNVRRNRWPDVLKVYEDVNSPKDLKNMKITRSGETALHMAVHNGDVKVVEKLTEELITLADNRGNTPLHLAAKMGSQAMCEGMANMKPKSIGDRNSDNETPLFLAALYGSQETFSTLAGICWNKFGYHKIYEYGRRGSDGSTVLHCAINEDCYDLAWDIIVGFPNFVHHVDERGYSPLHLLASKTSAFKSSSRLTWLQEIIYSCVPDEISWVKKEIQRKLDRHPDSKRVWNIMNFFPKQIVEVLDMKERQRWSTKIMDFIIRESWHYMYTNTGCKPTSDSTSINNFEINNSWYESQDNQGEKDSQVSLESSQKNKTEQETPILVATKNGITEIVSTILKDFSEAIYDVNSEGKNVILLAVENRQPHVYKMLLQQYVKPTTKDLLHHNDNDGNNALHLAAMTKTYQSWFALDAVLQMQWEIKWYEFIKNHMPTNMLTHQNKKGKTPEQIFTETHSNLLKNDTDWLMKTSDSCTIVAALIATVAFATSASLPGGFGNNGEPILKQQGMFEVFAISSLMALCFSLSAMLMFLSILTARHQVMDFRVKLPLKLLIGLTMLFISIAAMLVSFCGGHFFIIKEILKHAKITEYLVAFLPVTFFVIVQCPLYFKLFTATILKRDP